MWKGVQGDFVALWSLGGFVTGLVFFLSYFSSSVLSDFIDVLKFLSILGLFGIGGAFIGLVLDRARFIRDLTNFIDTFFVHVSSAAMQRAVDRVLNQRADACKYWERTIINLQQNGLKALGIEPTPDNIEDNRRILNQREKELQRQFRSSSKDFWRGYDLTEKLSGVLCVTLRKRSWKNYATPGLEIGEEGAKEEKKVS